MTTAALTCIASFGAYIYVCDEDGDLKCYSVDDFKKEDDESTMIIAQKPEWTMNITSEPISCIYVEEDRSARPSTENTRDRALIIIGSANGELFFITDHVETLELQLESTAMCICRHNYEFIVSDMVGNLYGVDHDEMLWKRKLASISPTNSNSNRMFPCSVSQLPEAIASITIRDIEDTQSSYLLISTGQPYLLVTHQEKIFGLAEVPDPITSIATFDTNLILAASVNGTIYRLKTLKNEEEEVVQFKMKEWFDVDFCIEKILAIPHRRKLVCLGANGQVVLITPGGSEEQEEEVAKEQERFQCNKCPLDITWTVRSLDQALVLTVVLEDSICSFICSS